MATQDFIRTTTLFRAFGNSVADAAFPGEVATTVASPAGTSGSSGVAAFTQASGSGSSHAPFIGEALIRFDLAAPGDVAGPATAKFGGGVVASLTQGVGQVAHLVRMPDVASFTPQWFTPTDLAAGDILFTTGPATTTASFHRFDLEVALGDPTDTVVLLLVPQACIDGSGYERLDWSFFEVSASESGTTSGAFDYAYAEYEVAPVQTVARWPLRQRQRDRGGRFPLSPRGRQEMWPLRARQRGDF